MIRYNKRKISRYLRIVYIVFTILFFIYCIVPLVFRCSSRIQRHLIFRHDVSIPSSLNFSDPLKEGIEGAFNRYIATESGIELGVWQILPNILIPSLHSSSKENDKDKWFLKQLSDSRPVVIYCHGNMPSRATYHRIMLYKILQKLDYHVITFDYRGYADSSETVPTEDGLVEDAMEIIKWTRIFSKSLLYVWGHSLGTGVATKALSKVCSSGHCPNGLVLQAPFTSIADELRSIYLTKPFRILPWFDYMFISPLNEIGIIFNSSEHIKDVRCPVLILHAEDDYVVPFSLGRKLYETGKTNRLKNRSSGLMKFIPFGEDSRYGHNDLYKAPELPFIIRCLLKSLMPRSDRTMFRDFYPPFPKVSRIQARDWSSLDCPSLFRDYCLNGVFERKMTPSIYEVMGNGS